VLHKRSKLDDSSVADIEKNKTLKNVCRPYAPTAKEFCAWLAKYIRYIADIWQN